MTEATTIPQPANRARKEGPTMATSARMHGSFERATPAQAQAAFDELNTVLPGDFTVYADAADVLPGEASRTKLVALRQRSMDARSVFLPLSDEAREVRVERQKLQARLAQLKLRREGGPRIGRQRPASA